MKFDEEQLLLNIETYLKANLNTKITAINAEKNDSIVLAQVNANAYAMDVDDKEFNYDPFLLFMIDEQTTDARGPASAQSIVVNVALIHADNGLDHNIVRRLLRYRRCLREVIEDNFRKINPCGELIIESLPILSFQRSSVSVMSKIVGINIITTIG